MRPFFTFALILIYALGFAQSRALYFKASWFKLDGSVSRTRAEPIKDTTAVYDLHFVSKHFYYLPLPTSFTSTTHKNQKIETSIGSNQTIRLYNLVYNDYGQVISFGRSGCIICSDLGYQFDIHYNAKKQPDKITGTAGFLSSSEKYFIRYNPNGNIKSIEYFVQEKLSARISLI